MKRDVVPKSTVDISVGLYYDVKDITTSKNLEQYLQSGLSKERYLLEQDFYKTYNPDVGFNTAFVLGTMLGTLLLYVIYRTKIRKPLIAFIKRKFKELRVRGKHAEIPILPEIEVHSNIEQNDNEENKTTKGQESTIHEDTEKINEDKRYHLLPTFSFSDEDEKQLPILVMDMETATADWVQKQHSFLKPGALLLKVKSDTICPQGKEINPSKDQIPTNIYGAKSQHCLSQAREQTQYIHNCKYSSSLNQSLPALKTRDSVKSPDNEGIPVKKIRLKGSQHDSVASEPRSPLTQYHSSQPVHLTPVIKIQNYDNSQRNSKPVRKHRRHSESSSSSDDPQYSRLTTEKWNTNNKLQRSLTLSDEKSACPYCRSANNISDIKQCSLDIPTDQPRFYIPVIDTKQASRSCQNIRQMESTL